MRAILLISVTLLTGCDHGFEFHPEEMTPEQMLDRSELAFIGVIEGRHFDSYPFFNVAVSPGVGTGFWHPLRRRVRVETVLQGSYSEPMMDVYEVFWRGGATGNWNATRDGGRYLFLVHHEGGRWRIVRDWSRSIFEVRNGSHARLPLDANRPFWERFALMNFWMQGDVESRPDLVDIRADPASTLGEWRTTKLLRGLLRHPNRTVRIAACVALDETRDPCERMFSRAEWDSAYSHGRVRRDRLRWDANREQGERDEFARMLYAQSLPRDRPDYTPWAMDRLRVLTTIEQPKLRREFCRAYMARFPGDTDNGCPADKPIPATIVTEDGDIPLIGEWPKK